MHGGAEPGTSAFECCLHLTTKTRKGKPEQFGGVPTCTGEVSEVAALVSPLPVNEELCSKVGHDHFIFNLPQMSLLVDSLKSSLKFFCG